SRRRHTIWPRDWSSDVCSSDLFGFSDNGGKFIRPGYQAATSNAAVANAALGLFDTYSEIGHRAYTIFRGSMWEGFGQDTWKVKRSEERRVGKECRAGWWTARCK